MVHRIDPRTLTRLTEVLREVPVPVYLLPGNHDAADASSLLYNPSPGDR